jgi:lipopolysaccharide export system permease protein
VAHEQFILRAREARYVPPSDDPQSGGWLLKYAEPEYADGWSRKDILENLGPGRYFLKTSLDFDTITRQKNWVRYIPTWRLLSELSKKDTHRTASVAVVFHMRLTRPLLGMILVFLGLSTILRDQNRNVYISAGLCLVLCAVFFAACFACKFLGDSEYLSPALAAWLPVMVFGPLAFVMFDAVHT